MDAEFAKMRLKMVDGQLRTTSVTDAAVLNVMGGLPREAFVPAVRRPLAYLDEDVEVSMGPGPARYLMEPSPFARLVQLAGVRPADRVLDIGAGTGYSAAVLSRLAAEVTALECDAALAASARATLAELGFDNVVVVDGPLEIGYSQNQPYDAVLVNGAVDEIPLVLFDQLADGGRLVAIVGEGNSGIANIWLKEGDGVSRRRVFNAAVRRLPGFQRTPAFEF